MLYTYPPQVADTIGRSAMAVTPLL